MGFLTRVKRAANRFLAPVNLQIETLTGRRLEAARLRRLDRNGYFDRPVFPVPEAFRKMDVDPILREVERHRGRFDQFVQPADNAYGFWFDNGFFNSPDVEILYSFIRRVRPRTIVEVGSGHSTRVSRLAIEDGGLETRLISIDPQPRWDVEGVTHELHRRRVEDVPIAFFEKLRETDILFIDSSHRLDTGSDVSFLFLNVLPRLASGVFLHVHDVFLPYDYPKDWVLQKRWGYNEQYLVQALLFGETRLEACWAAYYLLKSRPELGRYFPHARGAAGHSLWLRVAN